MSGIGPRPRRAPRESRATASVRYGNLQLVVACDADRSLRCLHAARDVLNGELSQGAGLGPRAKRLRLDAHALKLPPVVAVSGTDAKESGGYPNIVT